VEHAHVPAAAHVTLVIALASIVAGGIASIAGFGIGSVLTPTFSVLMPTNVAVAAVSVPHLTGTALRFWLLRAHVDHRVVLSFGITSAAGGLTGALLHRWVSGGALTIVFGLVLLFVAISELTGLSRRMRFRGPAAWIAGAASGLLGGLIGNQGGIRSAALLGFDVSKDVFIGTATAIGLIVDGARMPVYAFTEGHQVLAVWPLVLLATIGVAAGTLFGKRLLDRVPERLFRTVVALIIAALGIVMLARGAMTATRG
jgi:uncharacterized protein